MMIPPRGVTFRGLWLKWVCGESFSAHSLLLTLNFTDMIFKKTVIEDLMFRFMFENACSFGDVVNSYYFRYNQLIAGFTRSSFECFLADSIRRYCENTPEGFMDAVHEALK